MHSNPPVRNALAALTTIAALAVLPAFTAVAGADAAGASGKVTASQAAAPKKHGDKKKRPKPKPKPATKPGKQPADSARPAPERAPGEAGGKQPADSARPAPEPAPVEEGGKQPLPGSEGGRAPSGEDGTQPLPPNDGPVRLPGPVVDFPTKEPLPAVGGLRRELDSLRATIGVESPETSDAAGAASLADEFELVRTAIEERNAGQPTTGLLRKVFMGPAELRVNKTGATRMRMECTDNAVKACRGVVWLMTEDGLLVTQKRFRVPAGEATRLRLVIPTGMRRDGQKLVATATVRDASAAVWMSTRRLTLAT